MPNKVLDFPVELTGVIDSRLYRRLDQLFKLVYALQTAQVELPTQTAQVVQRQLQLLGVLREPLLGQEFVDPQLSAVASAPGTVVSLTGDPTNGLVTTGTSSITISFGPSLNVSTGYKVAGTQVVGAQGAAIPDATGGATIDAEARTAINALLVFFRNWGSIGP